jgi:hypothetical protein
LGTIPIPKKEKGKKKKKEFLAHQRTNCEVMHYINNGGNHD